MNTDTYLFDKRTSNGIHRWFPYLRFPHCIPLFILIPSAIIIHFVGEQFSFLTNVLLIIAVPNMLIMYFTSRLTHWQFMQKMVQKPFQEGDTFIERGLHYMGYTTTRISDSNPNGHELLLVNRTTMLYLTKKLTERDMRRHVTYAITNNIDSICIVKMSLFNITAGNIGRLADRHGIIIYSINDIFDALLKKVRTDKD